MPDYNAHVQVSRTDWNRWNSLLGIDDLDSLTQAEQALKPRRDDSILIAAVEYENDTKIDLYLKSGGSNYYTEAEMVLANGQLVPDLEPGDSLNTTEEITDFNTNTSYLITFDITED